MPDSFGDYNIVIDSDATFPSTNRFAVEVGVPAQPPEPLFVVREDGRAEVFGEVRRNGPHVIENTTGTGDVAQLWAGASLRAVVNGDGALDVSASGLLIKPFAGVGGLTPPVGTIVIISPTYLGGSCRIAAYTDHGWKYWKLPY